MGMGTGKKSNSKAALSEINITPLVDVMLVLLIMFMVTTPLMQQGIDVNLPKTSASGSQVVDDPFILKIAADQSLKVGKATIPMDQLKSKIQGIFKTRSQKQVFIQADKAVDYGVVAEAMAEIRAAGIFNISLVTNPKDQ